MKWYVASLRFGVVFWVIGITGCQTGSLVDPEPADTEGFIGVHVPDFGTAQAIPVQDDASSSESVRVSLPADLLENAPQETRLVLSAPDLLVAVETDPDLLQPADLHSELHFSVTFRISLPNQDACSSEAMVGPFDVTVDGDEITLDVDFVVLDEAVQAIVHTGNFDICAETTGDFDGEVLIDSFILEFGELEPNQDRVDLCHIPPANPDNSHTITVGESAVEAHLAHGDFLGQCDDEDDGDSDLDDSGSDPGDGDSGGGDSGITDSDADGVADEADACPGTPITEGADSAGCSCSQRDGDGDGVSDCFDQCPNTVDVMDLVSDGCSVLDLDEDLDGVLNAVDDCPATPSGEPVNDTGCSCSQIDEDADGVNNCDDFCPGTPGAVSVDAFGCEVLSADAGADVQLDQVGCLTLQATASGGTPPFTYFWSASEWEGSTEQNPILLPAVTTEYTLTVTDFSFPPNTATDTVTVTIGSADEPQYTIVDLGSLSANSSYPAGMNDAGDVVGFYFNDSSQRRAFRYSSGEMTDLGTLGGAGASANDINGAGQVVGEAQTSAGQWHAFVWDALDGMQDLGTLGGTSSVANAINEAGEVVGASDTGSATHAFFYRDGLMADLGTPDGGYSEAYDINDAGRVVGTVFPNGGAPQALIYDDGVLLDFEVVLFSSNRAWAVNASGLIVGHSWEPGVSGSFVYACDGLVDLGVLEGFSTTSAWALNDAGQVVGSATVENSVVFNAIVYSGGRLLNLNDLLVDAGAWEYLTAAFAVNGSGQIAGYGKIDGQFRGFLLTPVP